MKKLVFMFVAIVSMSFAACGGNKVDTLTANDSTATDTIDSIEVVDSVVTDSVITAE